MNWYIYWRIAIEEYFTVIFGKDTYWYRRYYYSTIIANITGWSFIILYKLCELTGAAVDTFFIMVISFALTIIDLIVFNSNSKRYRRWKETYKKCTTDNKEFFCFLTACVGLVSLFAILIYKGLNG